MDKMKKRVIGVCIAIVIVAAAVLAVYVVLNRQAQEKAGKEAVPTTEIEKLIAKDLELAYPETPTEVVKMYWRINCCIYNESSLSDEDAEVLLKQLRILYDDELLEAEGNSYEKMLKNLQKDRETYQDNKQKIGTAVIVQKNNTTEVKKVDGKECTSIISASLITSKGDTTKVYEEFLCRKDNDGNWKIVGWKQTTQEAAAAVDVN